MNAEVQVPTIEMECITCESHVTHNDLLRVQYGNVIHLECPVCHSRWFRTKKEEVSDAKAD